MTLEKRASELTIDDIKGLVDRQEPEGQRLDFKESLPGKGAASRELLKQVAGFANTTGGLILIGISEGRDESNRSTGLPTGIVGLPNLNGDQEKLTILSSISDGITPRILPRPEVETVACDDGKTVVAISVPRSTTRPHMVDGRFHARQGVRTAPLSVEQVRAEILGADGTRRRIREFQADRFARIMSGETPIKMSEPPNLVIHALPIRAFSDDCPSIDVQRVLASRPCPPGPWRAFNFRYTLDGVLSSALYTNNVVPEAASYLQMFRDGRIEAVVGGLVSGTPTGGEDMPTINLNQVADILVKELPPLVDLVSEDFAPYPLVLRATLLNAKGVRTIAPDYSNFSEPLNVDPAHLPDVILEQRPDNWISAWRDTLDALWQSIGAARCHRYDEQRS